MTVLVTGGAGFIGSHVVERMLNEQHEVVCIDNFDDYYDPRLKHYNLVPAMARSGFHLIEGDIRDRAVLDLCFDRYSIDLVIHLAARAGVRCSLTTPELYYDVNVMGTVNILEAMKKHGVSKLVFGSSSSVYGNNAKVPFSEEDSVDRPISPYAASKKSGELLCYTYHSLYGYDVFCLRFFTVYGPRQRPEMAIHRFVSRIINGELVTLYGDDRCSRDYTYVGDIVDGIFAAARQLRGFEIINLGGCHPVRTGELIEAIENVTGRIAIVRRKPMQPGDVMTTYADISRARSLLGYEPAHTLHEGLREFVRWYNQNKKIMEEILTTLG